MEPAPDLVGAARLIRLDGARGPLKNFVILNKLLTILVDAGHKRASEILIDFYFQARRKDKPAESATIRLNALSRRAMIREAESILRESGQLETRSEPLAKLRAFERAMGGKGTDTTITVAGHVFHASSCILVAGSSYFEGLMDRFEPGNFNHRLEGLESSTFRHVLAFMYTGSLDPFSAAQATCQDGHANGTMDAGALAAVALAADMLGIRGLVAECAEFIDASNALSVMATVADVQTPEMDRLFEFCASVAVRNAERGALGQQMRIPPRALCEIAAKTATLVGEVSVPPKMRSTVDLVWEAVSAWHGGASVCALQASLIAPIAATRAPVPASCRTSICTATSRLTPGSSSLHSRRCVFQCLYDVHLSNVHQSFVVEVMAHRPTEPIDEDEVAALTYAPQLVTVRTAQSSFTRAVIGPLGALPPIRHEVAPADIASDGTLRIEIEVDPVFALLSIVGARNLGQNTDASEVWFEVVREFHPDVLAWILRCRSVPVWYPVAALQEAASRDSDRDRREIVGALADRRLSHVPVPTLLTVLADAPVLGRVEKFYRLLVRLVISEGTGHDATVEALTNVVKCIGAARDIVSLMDQSAQSAQSAHSTEIESKEPKEQQEPEGPRQKARRLE